MSLRLRHLVITNVSRRPATRSPRHLWMIALTVLFIFHAVEAEEGKESNLDVSGFVDVYFSHNFDNPTNRANLYRNFDVNEGHFALNLSEVVLQKKVDGVGFRLDIDFGQTTDLVHTIDTEVDETYKHIQQAYVTFNIPAGKGITADVGKFVTHMGYEVIETKDNINYSRSLLFAWAIPYFHTGARLNYPVSDKVALNGYVYNGWNRIADNNTAFTYGAQAILTPSSKVSFIQNWIGGPENPDSNDDWRHVFDSILTITPSAKASISFNYDYGWQAKAVGGTDDAVWQGIAGYVRYAHDDRCAVIPRLEWFRDRDGFATGTAQDLTEFTLTLEVKKSGLLIRPEFRVDWSDKEVFTKESGETVKSQPTVLVGLVQTF